MFSHDVKFPKILKLWGRGVGVILWVKEDWGWRNINIHPILNTSYKIKISWYVKMWFINNNNILHLFSGSSLNVNQLTF